MTGGVDGLGSSPEFDAVREILRGARVPDGGRTRPGDDAAELPAADGWAVSVDTTVEGTHFRLDWITATEAGGRAVRGALSDLAAAGARPVAVLLALSGPDRDLLIEAGRGAREAAESSVADLIGGDLAQATGPLTIGVTVLGDLEGRSMLTRAGAGPTQPIWVTGRLGAAAAAVMAWREGSVPDVEARAAFVSPEPRWAEALWLRERVTLGATIDLSDGLAADAVNLGRASGVGVRVHSAAIPIAAPAAARPDGGALALRGGEDYELLFAADLPEDLPAAFRARFGLDLTRVGETRDAEGCVLVREDGSEIPLGGGFGHWQGGSAESPDSPSGGTCP